MNEVERRELEETNQRTMRGGGRKHAATFAHGAVRLARINDIGEKGRGDGGDEGAHPVVHARPPCLPACLPRLVCLCFYRHVPLNSSFLLRWEHWRGKEEGCGAMTRRPWSALALGLLSLAPCPWASFLRTAAAGS